MWPKKPLSWTWCYPCLQIVAVGYQSYPAIWAFFSVSSSETFFFSEPRIGSVRDIFEPLSEATLKMAASKSVVFLPPLFLLSWRLLLGPHPPFLAYIPTGHCWMVVVTSDVTWPDRVCAPVTLPSSGDSNPAFMLHGTNNLGSPPFIVPSTHFWYIRKLNGRFLLF